MEGAADYNILTGKEVFIMPGFDGTGPRGEGSMTGGARGYCNPGYAAYGRGYGPGRGYRGGFGTGPGSGRGYGRGYGWRGAYQPVGGRYGSPYNNPYNEPYSIKPEDEINILKDEAAAMKSELDAIYKRIEKMES